MVLLKGIRMDKLALGFWMYEVIFPFIFSFSISGIFKEVKERKLFEVYSIIPEGLLSVMKERVKRTLLMIMFLWFFLVLSTYSVFKINPSLYTLVFWVNVIFFGGIIVLNESLINRPVIGIIAVLLTFIFWVNPFIQSNIGRYGFYRFINPFYFAFSRESHGFLIKTVLLALGLLLYFAGGLYLKKAVYLYKEG